MNTLSRIQQLSNKKGVTMYTISQETGISQSVFSRLKTETTAKLSRKNLDILANYFCVNADWLATGSGDMYSPGVVKDTKLHDDALWERIKELAINLFTPDNNKHISFIDYKEMEKATNIAAPRLSNIIRENQFPTYTELLNIINSDTLNTSSEWLLTGKGSMLKSDLSPQLEEKAPITGNTIKYYPSVNGSMGGIEFLDNPEEFYTDIVLPGFSECKFAVNAFGDSMYPVIKSGQIVIMMPWTERFIDWGHIYMVVTKSGYRAIKYLKPSSKEGCITCESENKESSPAFDVDMEDIHKLYLVKGWICRDAI